MPLVYFRLPTKPRTFLRADARAARRLWQTQHLQASAFRRPGSGTDMLPGADAILGRQGPAGTVSGPGPRALVAAAPTRGRAGAGGHHDHHSIVSGRAGVNLKFNSI